MPSNKKLLQAAAGSAGGDNLFVEDVFSTYVYDSTHGTSPIVNGINLADEGGLVWFKHRTAGYSNILFDTERGTSNHLVSNTTAGNATSIGLGSFNTDGFSFSGANLNVNSASHVAWTFRKAEGFFDVVTYTGNGTAGRTVAHSLGSVPKMIFVKNITTGRSWNVYHANLDSSNPAGYALKLNSTAERQIATEAEGGNSWNSTEPTASEFTLGNYNETNENAQSYVAYIFGDDAIFGEYGDEQICKMGSFTPNAVDGTGSVDLGFEPQFLMVKNYTTASNWFVFDNMRGMPVGSADNRLFWNTSGAETTSSNISVTATGFDYALGSNPYIYMAIRRPMKVPEAGTEVFSPIYSTASTNTKLTTTFPIDLQIYAWVGGPYFNTIDRLRGVSTTDATYSGPYLQTINRNAEPLSTGITNAFDNTGFKMIAGYAGYQTIFYSFKRAPKFMDVVAYTGNGSVRTINHNLQVAPDLMIVKCRSANSSYWVVYDKTGTATDYLYLDSTNAQGAFSGYWNNTEPTSTVFTLGTGNGDDTNASSQKYIAYLFATLAGISKVGSVVHSGTTNVDCGFSAGARFVLVKRTDSTGDWWVWDTARGIVSGNDPYLRLNSSNQQNTADYIDPLASGFTLTSSFTAGTYIFLAIA